ncbi:MAG TPA: 50S ribosomal protein L18 [Polyangia bacterium]|nr:50S ribosomal protein L18 [Polyangia bacterium]
MLTNISFKKEGRKKRHNSARKRISGTAERPRLAVFRSAKHIYVQVIDDATSKTLVATSDQKLEKSGEQDKKDRAKKVGADIAKKCLEKGIDKVVFDRAGYKYHGRVSALADGAREAGLKF